MNPLTDLDPVTVARFAALALTACAGVVLTSGYFPAVARPTDLRRSFAPALVAAGVAVTAALAVAALWAGWQLPLAVAVVVGGCAILLAPFVVQPLPESLRDSRLGAALFVIFGLAVLGLALLAGGGPPRLAAALSAVQLPFPQVLG